jgi:hypothetical protein
MNAPRGLLLLQPELGFILFFFLNFSFSNSQPSFRVLATARLSSSFDIFIHYLTVYPISHAKEVVIHNKNQQDVPTHLAVKIAIQ